MQINEQVFLLTLWLPPRWKTTTMTMTTTTGRVGEKQIMQLVLRLATSSRQQQQQQADLLESCFWNSLAATTNASSFSRSKAFHPTGATATKTKVQQPHGAANQLVDCKLVCWLLLQVACLLPRRSSSSLVWVSGLGRTLTWPATRIVWLLAIFALSYGEKMQQQQTAKTTVAAVAATATGIAAATVGTAKPV